VEGKKSWPNWGTMPADAWRNWEKPVKEPVALFIEPNCPTCSQELYVGCPAHWAVTGRNDLAHKSETQGHQELEHWVVSDAAHNRGPPKLWDQRRVQYDWNLPVVTPVAVECSSSSSSPSEQPPAARVTVHLSYRQSVHVICASKDGTYVTCSQSVSPSTPFLDAFSQQLRKAAISKDQNNFHWNFIFRISNNIRRLMPILCRAG